MSGKTAAAKGDVKSAGNAKKPKVVAGKANGASTPVAADEPLTTWPTSSKPDKEVYNKEQDDIKAAIAVKQAALDKVKSKIADGTGAGPAGEKRKALRAEQNEIRQKTAGQKLERGNLLDQIKALQDGVQKKIKDMNNQKSKVSYKSVAEIDGRIKELDLNVESGSMSLVNEKRALSEISELRKARRNFDGFGSQQDGIDSDKAKIDEFRAQLDNSEYKAIQERYQAIQAELDELNKELDSVNSSRDKLYEERNRLNEEVNKLYGKKKESASNFREANDKYFTRVNEERSKRIERQQAERRAYEDSKRREINEKQLEEARAPAFDREIEDCGNLIAYFSRFASGDKSVPEPKLSTAAKSAPGVGGVPALELRKADDGIPEGAVIMKKGGADDDSFFAGTGGKKGKKGAKRTPAAATNGEEKAKEASQALNVPFQTVAALLQFNISAPLSRDDVPKTVDALQEKKSWYLANNDRVTKERIAAAEDRIRQAEAKASVATPASESKKDSEADATEDAVEEKEAEKDAEVPAEEVAKLTLDGDKTEDA